MTFFVFTGKAQIQVNDSLFLFMDSIYAELPEVMISGERPIVKSENGKLIYDMPRLITNLPVNNAYDAIKELPGIVEQNESLTLAGSNVNVIINGKVSTLTQEQFNALLKTIPVSRIQKAEVMYSAPARYQVRGPMINLILKRNEGGSELQGEIFSLWHQKHYGKITERASLFYTHARISTDLLYSYSHGKSIMRMEKDALHHVNGIIFPINTTDIVRYNSNSHNIRWGTDFSISENNTLSFVYTTQFSNNHNHSEKSGTEFSQNKKSSENNLQNVKLDYHSPSGINAGAEFTFYKSPGVQNLYSILNQDTVYARYEDKQRINKWKFYITNEQALQNNWQLNYGINYTTSVDNSFQYYFDAGTGAYDPDKSMKSRRKEYTINGFTGFSKGFNEKLSMDASFAAELYHTDIWNEWMFYPTFNMNYVPIPGQMIQLSLSSDKSYPSYWEMNNTIGYIGVYSEIHGNPELKPSPGYKTNLTYIMKGKYVFTAFFNYDKDYAVQTLYQSQDRLVEMYKTFNFDYRRQLGLQATVPYKIKNWLNSRVTLIGMHIRQKNSNFWDTSFDRSKYSAIGVMNNTVTFPIKPDIRLNISCFYQSGAIQGIYDLDPSFNLDASLSWTFARQKAQFTLKGMDLFETSAINPKIRFENQNVTNRFTQTTRGFELSFSYKFGNYKDKKREDVDTSRFK
jgi:hypothetical protein